MSKIAPAGALTFETAMAELEQIVRGLESGQGTLDDAIASYARGAELRAFCAQKLKDIELKIEQISRDANGNLTTTPFEQANG